ncbi:E3 ubiquitin-protein ligase SINAT4-like [Chrysoperla carnea]|uniref:E3 ubiquitin-protein ligase SINAT4-like n=1 Tax=Chrysoperla carnea TaxID=189513 RepID=UPI001D08FC83|nr:E3 ubiquitin-protein ligase SINAT4-like [Chrysoperla carnea]
MAVYTVSADWGWPEMEEVLQCPICFELPCGPVLMCVKGHHICSPCRKKVHNCPLCKESFAATRNFAVEELLANISVIKNIMTLANIQIKTPCGKPSAQQNANSTPKPMPTRQLSKVEPPVQSRGEFPCVFCTPAKVYPVSRILIHLRYAHADELSEVSSENQRANFQVQFKHQSKNSNEYGTFKHRAVKIDKLGLFYISYGIMNDKPHVFLRMVARTKDSQKYMYSLKVNDALHSNKAVCCREPLKQLVVKGDCLVLNSNYVINRNRSFAVNVTVCRDSSED